MLGDFLETITKDEKIILSGCHFNVVFYAENEADFRSYEQMVANEFKNLDITPYAPIGANKKNLFLIPSLPMLPTLTNRILLYP